MAKYENDIVLHTDFYTGQNSLTHFENGEEILDAGIYEPPPLPIIPLLPNCVHDDLVATDVYIVSTLVNTSILSDEHSKIEVWHIFRSSTFIAINRELHK